MEPNRSVRILLRKPQIEQQSDEWFDIRRKKITATQVGTIMGISPFQSPEDLYREKKNKSPMNKNLNENIKWGYFHERFAKLEYEKMFNTKVFPLGLLNHDSIDWLAASPDGIVNNDKYGAILVEFKCPLKRKFKHDAKVLNYYWMQCQIQMEVCNIDATDLFECWFDENQNLVHYKNTRIFRDKHWFDETFDTLKLFYQALHSKRKRNDWNLHNLNETTNYLIGQPCIDWLVFHGMRNNLYPDEVNCNQMLVNQRILFYQNVYSMFNYTDVPNLGNLQNKYDYTNFLINKNTNIIRNAVLRKDDYMIEINLLFRKDIFNQRFKENEQASYIPVLVENNSIELTGKGKIVNDCVKIRCQLVNYVTNTPVYVISRSCRRNESKDKWNILDCVSKYDSNEDISDKIEKAYQWLNLVPKLKYINKLFEYPEYYPVWNRNVDQRWCNAIKKLCYDIGELTLLWNIGLEKRNYLHSKNIYHISQLQADDLNFSDKYKKPMEFILQGLRDKSKKIIRGGHIEERKTDIEFFVDFEVLSREDVSYENFPEMEAYEMIYQIGLGWRYYGRKWNYKMWLAKERTLEEEKRIIEEWLIMMKLLSDDNAPVYHWYKAEQIFFNKAIRRHNMNWTKPNWVDLHELYTTLPIVIAGMHSFQLKEITRALRNFNLVEKSYEDLVCQSGRNALSDAWDYYYNENKSEEHINNMKNYNELDCFLLTVLLDIGRI